MFIMNQRVLYLGVIIYANVILCHAARILVFVPTASVSHQAGTRELSLELAQRGHEVVVITPNPMFTDGTSPNNYTEIDVSEVGYAAKIKSYYEYMHGRKKGILPIIFFNHVFSDIFEAEIKTDQVQALLNDKNQSFDLLILEACTVATLIFTHIFKAPAVLVSSFGVIEMFTDYTGAATHPILFPNVLHKKISNLTMYDKVFETYMHYKFENTVRAVEKKHDEMIRRNFGLDIPLLRELKKNIAMVLINEHHLWDNNRPVPPNMVYIGGIYPQKSTKELPKDIESYLDASSNGVVYVSFGTTVFPRMLPQKIIQTIVKVLSQLPYDVFFKWDNDNLPGISKNVKIFQWLPQAEVLRHPKIKLFITQGGKQSTDDAIAAGVPLVGMPIIADQWYNVEQYVRFKIGLKVDIETLTEETMLKAINTVINDESYRRNIVALRENLCDQPQTALEKAVWWSEYVIRHKGAPQLRAPTALISNWEYYEGDLVLVIGFCTMIIAVMFLLLFYCLFRFYCHVYQKRKTE